MNQTSIATRVTHLPSRFSSRANEFVSGRFVPSSTARYTVLTVWGEQHFRTLADAKSYAVVAKSARSFNEACHAFIAR